MLDDIPAAAVDTALRDLDDALTRRDIDAAAALFAEECYWRDLVAFTWNITHAGRPRRRSRDMLESQLAAIKPPNWAFVQDARTPTRSRRRDRRLVHASRPASARGYGHVRLQGRQDLDAADHA